MSGLLYGVLVARTLLAPPPGGADEPPAFTSFAGEIPPELVVADDGWINWKGELSLGALRGHVVWLQFSFLH